MVCVLAICHQDVSWGPSVLRMFTCVPLAAMSHHALARVEGALSKLPNYNARVVALIDKILPAAVEEASGDGVPDTAVVAWLDAMQTKALGKGWDSIVNKTIKDKMGSILKPFLQVCALVYAACCWPSQLTNSSQLTIGGAMYGGLLNRNSALTRLC